MRIVSLDLDRQGEGRHLHLGPFSSGMNTICGPSQSGKTRLVHLLRRLFFDSRSINHRVALGASSFASSQESPLFPTESNVFSDECGAVHVTDDRIHYRLSAQRPYEAVRLDARIPSQDALHRHIVGQTESTETPVWKKIPEYALSTIFLDAFDASQCSSLWETARLLGIGTRSYRKQDDKYDALVTEENDLKNRLRHANFLNHDRSWWVSEKLRVEARLKSGVSDRTEIVSTPWSDLRRLEEQVALLHNEVERLRADEEELLRSIQDRQERLKQLEQDRQVPSPETVVAVTRRKQLEEIDQRLNQWRQTLRDIREQREKVQQSIQEQILKQQMDLGNLKNDNPRIGLEALESQIINTRRHVEEVISRDEASSGDRVQLQRSLPDTLRTMQEGVYEVCQQMSRTESKSFANKLKNQADQLGRCESELAYSIERAIEDRGALLKRIAQENNIPFDRLSLAVGDWCQCQSHPHLYNWLFTEQTAPVVQPDLAAISTIREELRGLTHEQARVRQRIEDALRECHSSEIRLKELRSRQELSSGATLTHAEMEELQRRLKRADEALSLWDQHGLWTLRLQQIREELRHRTPYRDIEENILETEANRYLRALTGDPSAEISNVGFLRGDATWEPREPSRSTLETWRVASGLPSMDSSQNDSRGPWYQENRYRSTQDRRIVEQLAALSIRMAIADAMAPQMGRFPMVIDQALLGMHGEALDRALLVMRDFAQGGQQVLLLTAEEEIASRARVHQGWVCHLQPPAATPVHFAQESRREHRWYEPDVNKYLHAYANEEDAESWPLAAPIPERRPSAIQGNGRQYFLSERSWIDEVPSIDRETADRLREIGISDVASFLRSKPMELADLIGSDRIHESKIRTWQSEAALMCRVPQLRAFDARLLVACGIASPQLLAKMHPGELLQKVESFLATEKGQDLLRTANSYELSRVTTWIVSAKRATPAGEDRNVRTYPRERVHNTYEREFAKKPDSELRPWESHGEGAAHQGRHSSRAPRKSSQELASPERVRKPKVRSNDAGKGAALREQRKAQVVPMAAPAVQGAKETSSHRFYLDASSPIVDAPTIGPQLAERLQSLGIRTVSDLLLQEASSVAARLQHKRFGAKDVQDWQDQAKLVCCIPNLRGHDAQLLVAAGITQPEVVAKSQPDLLYEKISRVAGSKLGQRILRGSDAPDKAEVEQWILWSKEMRPLRAA